jgi:hypothetical protein
MRMRTRGNVVMVALGLAIGACGDGSTNVEEPVGNLADAVCDLVFGCCTGGEAAVLVGPYVTVDDCAERLVNSATLAPGSTINLGAFGGGSIVLPNLADLQRAIDDGRTEVDNDAVAACLAVIEATGCNTIEDEEPPTGCVPPEPVEETPCDEDKLFIGTVGDGGQCSSPGTSFECKPGLACRSGGATGVNGACVEPGDVNDLCFFDAECKQELYCSQFDGTCQIPKAEGETCVYSNPDDPDPPAATLLVECAETLSCDPVTDTCVAACQRGASCFSDLQCDEDAGLQCIIGRCGLPRGIGLPCNANDDCESDRCDFDPNVSEFVCVAKLANGDACNGDDADCASGFCDTTVFECAAQVAPPGLCPSARDPQCADSYCETTTVFCTSDTECVGSGTCDLVSGICEYYCVALRADGAACTRGGQCQSETCVNGFCRTVPLADGEPCNFASECESEFCGFELTRVCTRLPLANGGACTSGTQCSSGLCFAGQCDTGLGDGDRCDQAGTPPCGRDLYCDTESSPIACVPVREAGEGCASSVQCRGACTIAFGRTMCDATPAEGAAVCDGG